MAKITYLQLDPKTNFSYRGGLSSGDRFTTSRLRRSLTLMTRSRLKGLRQATLLPQIKLAWGLLSQGVKDAWTSAGHTMGLSGYRLYVKDKTLRIKNSMSGDSVPNNLYQTLVGNLHIESPASSLAITQLHPQKYWVSRKVTGSKNQYYPVKVIEDFDIPLELSINYKSNLVAVGPNPVARFYATVYSLYQGRTLENTCEITFGLQDNWRMKKISLATAYGKVSGYNLVIELKDLTGDLFIDHVEAFHSGQNWCRDSYCNDIDQNFTKAFYQVPKHWAPLDLPEGSSFASVFFDGL